MGRAAGLASEPGACERVSGKAHERGRRGCFSYLEECLDHVATLGLC
jgi:hypothetical protein